tara:strand:+ start:1038 stop:1217 length:180 start_codon:yes stop_codon:yes gene_type:complete
MEIKTRDEDVIGVLLEGFETEGLCNFLNTEWEVIGFDYDGNYHTFVLMQYKYKLSLRCR